MKKKLLALTLAVSLLAGALAGCTRPQAQTTPTPAPTQTPEATATPTPAGEKADDQKNDLHGFGIGTDHIQPPCADGLPHHDGGGIAAGADTGAAEFGTGGAERDTRFRGYRDAPFP